MKLKHLSKLHSPAADFTNSLITMKDFPWEIAAIFEKIAAWAKRYKWEVSGMARCFPPSEEMEDLTPKDVYFMQLGRGMMDEHTSEWMEFEIADNLVCINGETVVNLCDPKSLDEIKGLIQFYD